MGGKGQGYRPKSHPPSRAHENTPAEEKPRYPIKKPRPTLGVRARFPMGGWGCHPSGGAPGKGKTLSGPLQKAQTKKIWDENLGDPKTTRSPNGPKNCPDVFKKHKTGVKIKKGKPEKRKRHPKTKTKKKVEKHFGPHESPTPPR